MNETQEMNSTMMIDDNFIDEDKKYRSDLAKNYSMQIE